MIEKRYDIVIIGSGAGGGTVAAELAPLVAEGKKILVLEKGPKLADHEYTGRELEMASQLYEEGGGFLTEDKTMTLAFGRVYGGSTVVYTGTSLTAPERVIESWNVPGLDHGDLVNRTHKYIDQNNVHLLEPDLLNDNNRLFVEGCKAAGYPVEQFPLNLKGCKGSSLCNLGCPNGAKQGTHRVQLPAAERQGVEVVTMADALRLEEKTVIARISEKQPGTKGEPSPWKPGDYRIRAETIVVAGGSIGSSALLLRSNLPVNLPKLGEGFTCHPAHILVAEHEKKITNSVGHPKSFVMDRATEEGFVLETCMYFPFTTAKNMTGFGENHSRFMQAYSRLQMILVLACDKAVPGNRISVDREGKPIVHYKLTPPVIRSLVAATRAASRIFFGAGAVRVHAPSANPPTIQPGEESRIDEKHFLPGKISISAAHLMGGCGMGSSPADSVTDSWGRVHGIPWLRVADSSLFPDSLEINPYLTIMSLADRAAEGIRNDMSAPVGAIAERNEA